MDRLVNKMADIDLYLEHILIIGIFNDFFEMILHPMHRIKR